MSEIESQQRIAELEQRLAALERESAELWQENQRLGHERIVGAGSGATSGITTELDLTNAEIERIESSLGWRLTAPIRLPRKLARWLFHRIKPALRALATRIFR